MMERDGRQGAAIGVQPDQPSAEKDDPGRLHSQGIQERRSLSPKMGGQATRCQKERILRLNCRPQRL